MCNVLPFFGTTIALSRSAALCPLRLSVRLADDNLRVHLWQKFVRVWGQARVPPPFGCTLDVRPAVMQSTTSFVLFNARCTKLTVQGAVLLSHMSPVRLSVRDVGGS